MVVQEAVQDALYMGHDRNSNECKARFDAIFSRRGESVGRTPKPVADVEETNY